MKQKKRPFIFFVFLSLFNSCGHFNKSHDHHEYPSREIANEKAQFYKKLMLNLKHNQAFNQLFESTNAKERTLSSLSRLKELYFKNQSLLNQFDTLLDQGHDPINTDLYSTIWAARAKKDRLEHELVFNILKLQAIANSSQTKKSNKAYAMLDDIANYLESIQEYQKVAFVDTFQKLNNFSSALPHSTQKSLDNGLMALTAPMEEYTDQDFNWDHFFNKNGDKIKKESLKYKPKKSLLKSKKTFIDRSRFPNSSRVYPSTDKAGNIFGYRFPKGTWALTFDDGPRSSTTEGLLEFLNDHNFKATFFWLAKNALISPEMAELAKNYGMALESHSFTHPNITKLSKAKINYEIIEATETLENIYQQKVKFFRLPYGAGLHNHYIRKLIADKGMIHTYWNIDSLDWQDKHPRRIFRRIKKQMKRYGRGIILLHDIHPQSVAAAKLLVKYVEKENRSEEHFKFKSLPEIINELNADAEVEVDTANAHPAADIYHTTAGLYVREGYGTQYSRCALLPKGTSVKIISQDNGFALVQVRNPSSSLKRSLRNCDGNTFVSFKYLSH